MAFAAFGCSSSRSTINVAIPRSADAGAGPAVRVSQVTDERTASASAAGRDRVVGASGGHLVQLDPQTSVTDVVRHAVEEGLRQAGFRPLNADEPATADTPDVRVDILQLWMTGDDDPALPVSQLSFVASLEIDAGAAWPIGREGPLTVTARRGTYHPPLTRMFGGPRRAAWTRVFDEGIAALVQAVRTRALSSPLEDR